MTTKLFHAFVEIEMFLSKEEAHEILDQARVDRLVPYNMICKALVATGDLQGFNRTIDRTLCEHGPDSRYVRTRSLHGEAIESGSNGSFR